MVEYFDGGDLACYKGHSFRRDKRTGYFLSSKRIGESRKRLHVFVWETNNAPIPKGYHVHHKDKDKNNNELENLALIHGREHVRLHNMLLDSQQSQQRRENIITNALPKAKEWHSSREGLQWHSEHMKQTCANWKPREYICSFCGEPYMSKHRYAEGKNTFCSNNCKSAFRRKSHIDDISKICVACGGEFIDNKYRNTKRCPICRNSKH